MPCAAADYRRIKILQKEEPCSFSGVRWIIEESETGTGPLFFGLNGRKHFNSNGGILCHR